MPTQSLGNDELRRIRDALNGLDQLSRQAHICFDGVLVLDEDLSVVVSASWEPVAGDIRHFVKVEIA